MVFTMTKSFQLFMALVYLLMAAIPAYQAIQHTNVEVEYLKKSYELDNFQNHGAIKEVAVWKDMISRHHFLGPLIKHFFEPSINKQFHIPSQQEAQQALDRIPDLVQEGKDEGAAALFWSLILLALSFFYSFLALTLRDKARWEPLFALTLISVVFLVVGVMAPAMVIIVSPKNEVFPHFVLHYEVRSILGVILELYSTRFWFIGVCLTVFSMVIPLIKAGLAFFVLGSESHSLKRRIAKVLHAISKWSMADVFVAAILLSNFAIKANRHLQADLFLGFYFFLGYCMLSMVATTLLQNKVESGG